MESETIQRWLTEHVALELSCPAEEVEAWVSFFELGLDSVTQMTLTGELGEWLGLDLPETLLQTHDSIAAVARYLARPTDNPQEVPWTPRLRVDPLPVSSAQERILKFGTLEAPGDRNLISDRFIIRGPLNLAPLRQALTEILRRHEILRSTFGRGDAGFFQTVNPPAPARLEVFDVAGMLDPEASAFAMSQVYASQPMQLTRGPLFRTLLFRLAEGVHGLTFIFHHVLIDARGLEIFHRELSLLYASYSAGEAPMLAEPVLQMADFALWERETLRPESESFQRHLQWWRDYLESPLPPPLEVPLRWQAPPRTPPPITDCLINLPIPAACLQRIREVAREEATTPFMLCFSAFAVLLHRRTGVKEFFVGVYQSDRKRTVAQEMIGMFAAMVPVRIHIDTQLTIRQFLKSLHQDIMQIRSHQHLPFEDLQMHLRAEGRPVPEIPLVYHHSQDTVTALRPPGLKTSRWREPVVSEMPWGFQFVIREIDEHSSIIGAAADGNIYDPAKLRQMAEDYRDLLASLTQQVDQPVSAPAAPS